MYLTPTPAMPPPTLASTAASTDCRASVAASQLDGVCNQPRILHRVRAFAGDVAQRVRSTFSSMLDRVGNLLSDCLPRKKEAVSAQAPAAIDPHAELLKAGASSLLNSIPALQSMLLKPNPNSAEFATDFRSMGVGVRALERLAMAGLKQGTVPEEHVRALSALVAPATCIAYNETEGQLFARAQRGDVGFLSDPLVKLELHHHFRRVRDAAVAIAAQAGAPELALQLDALYRHERLVD